MDSSVRSTTSFSSTRLLFQIFSEVYPRLPTSLSHLTAYFSFFLSNFITNCRFYSWSLRGHFPSFLHKIFKFYSMLYVGNFYFSICCTNTIKLLSICILFSHTIIVDTFLLQRFIPQYNNVGKRGAERPQKAEVEESAPGCQRSTLKRTVKPTGRKKLPFY